MIDQKTSSDIGRALTLVAQKHPMRFRVRESGSGAFLSANLADQNLPGVTCPEQTGKTDNCGTCGLCFYSLLNINFIGHGRDLNPEHNAIVNGTTIFQKTIKTVDQVKNVLKFSSNKKLGKTVVKGKWSDHKFMTLTLTERETCPASCLHWSDCYGNGMRFAQRIDVTGLMEAIEAQLTDLPADKKYAIRLHVLGDFYSVAYVAFWDRMMDKFPNIKIFGYTAHPIDNSHLKES